MKALRFARRAGISLALLAASSASHAVANGDGTCSSAEANARECGSFGTNVVEFLGAYGSNQCRVSSSTTPVPCTAYFYRYSGTATNQLNVAIPLRVAQTFKTAGDINCSQFLVNGAGDPTTGFGKNQLSLGVCRVANNLVTAPVDVTIPPGANLVLTLDPSSPSATSPLDWQLKQSNNVFPASIAGPFETQAPVFETAATLVTPDGATVSYTNIGGQLKITGGNARLVPPGGTKLCVLNVGGDKTVPYTSPAFAANWTCETITYATEQCDIKTDGGDPCRMIGGTCVKY
ncbi:MAG: hypothetical protein K2Y51_27385 [Gammaproteobacteria bacterium]|nr:hypothetical protein [Gammaproteobacteria bacterium]